MNRSAPMLLRLAALPLALLLAAPATLAQDTPPRVPGSNDISQVTAGTYQTDPAHTLVGWRVGHFGFNDYFGQFGNITGSFTIDPANLNATSADLTIPVSGLATASSALTTHMQSADFFDAANHPNVRFVSTGAVVNGAGATLNGNLTIRGVTRPVSLNVRFIGAGINPMNRKRTVGFHATTTIRRSDFGMTYAVPLVDDEVMLDISAAFERDQ